MSAPNPNDERRRLGFPAGTTFLDLRVSIPAGCIVVVATRNGDPVRSDRIYVREFAAPKYRELVWPDACNSWAAPLLSHCAPELFVLGQLWRDSQALPNAHNSDPPLRGGGPVGLYRVRLPFGEPELLSAAHHKPDPVSDSDHWYLS